MIQSKHGVIKGLSVAIIVVSILSICIALAFGGICALSGAFLGDTTNQEKLYKGFTDAIEDDKYELYDDDDINKVPFLDEYESKEYSRIYELDQDSFVWLVQFGMFIIIGLIVFTIIKSIFTLIVGIYGLKASKDYNKLRVLSGLSIAGIVISLIFFSFITLILMIILLVYTSKQRDFLQALNNKIPQILMIIIKVLIQKRRMNNNEQNFI